MPRQPKSSQNPEPVNCGSLKLPPADAARFKAALEFYGFESTALFLRRAGYALLKHYDRKESLGTPLTFARNITKAHSPEPP